MPFVQVKMLLGRTDEQKKKVIEGITDVLVNEANAKREAVIVAIEEIDPKHYAVGGELMADKLKK